LKEKYIIPYYKTFFAEYNAYNYTTILYIFKMNKEPFVGKCLNFDIEINRKWVVKTLVRHI